MLQSQLFTKVERAVPKGEVALNAQLLERGGFVYKNSAGVYTFLPLGWRVIQKVAAIIREEMNAVGGQELFMPALVEKKYLDATKRWDVNVGYEVRGKNEKSSSFSLGWTHEEVLTAIAAKYISSYKDLPFAAYQIQTKFRNEPRAKSGLLRGREFMMKDLYSFHVSEKDLLEYYGRVAVAYGKIFNRCGLRTIYTVAAGGTFTISNTHEFQVVSEVGEDTIYVCAKCEYAENSEISKLKDGGKCPKCSGKIEEKKSIEVGNIFPLGTKYSEAFDLKFRDKDGSEKLVVMGSYGIGLGRLMATAVEVYHDETGIIWPDSIAPFKAHLIELGGANGRALYDSLQKEKIDVLYDERDKSPGEKFAEADLLGIPWRLVVSPKLEDRVEVKKRGAKEAEILDQKAAIKLLNN
ncbi:MAG: aminoacyl--tRNA ligase-related protein [Candidatus Liptonbacteria bacterium]|nr:aminoacyl--tRNA ligase-related protein [Candidatus Liptonbacteria bacterium]